MPAARAAGGNKYAVSLKFNVNAWGWTETYYIAGTGATPLTALGWAQRLTTLRRGFLDKAVSVFGATIKSYVPGEGPNFYSSAQIGGGPGVQTARAEAAWLTAMYRVYDQSVLYRRSGWVRGLPVDSFVWKPDGTIQDGLSDVPELVRSFVRLVSNLLPDPLIRGTFCIRGRSHDRTVTSPVRILAASPAEDGCNTVLDLATDRVFADGDKVHIHNVQACGIRGLNGDRTVVKQVGRALTVTGGPCCCADYVVLPTGEVSSVVYDFYAIAMPGTVQLNPISRVTKHSTGASFGGTRGRRRKKCG